jgi:hypothetical protein
MRKLLRATGHGFTLVEILVMSPVIMLTIIIMMSFLFNQYGQLTQEGAQINLNVEAQNIVFSMQDDIFYANEFSSNLNSNLNDNYDPSGGWTYNTNPDTLIISTPALTGNRRADDRQPVYINTEGCDEAVITENSPLYNNVIYFVSGTTLFKRIVTAPSTLATCGTSFVKTSCPSGSASSSCPADRTMTSNLNSFNITYYDTNNTVVSVPEQATKVKIDLELKDRAYATDIYSTSSITLKRLNQ